MDQRFCYTKAMSIESIKDTIRQVKMPKNSFVIFFVSSKYDFKQVAALVQEEFTDTPNIGCISTGEITTEGYVDSTFSIFSIYSPDFKVAPLMLTNLNKHIMLYKRNILETLSDIGVDVRQRNYTNNFFVISLIDAFAKCEERLGTLMRIVFDNNRVNLVGGSAGDTERGVSYVAMNGQVEQDACALLFIKTSKKIMTYNENIYTPKGEMHRVTEADFLTRTVIKADGKPFLDLYSQEIGVPKNKINSDVFAKNPIGRTSEGNTYIASPLCTNPDGSITFYTKVLTGRQFYFMEAANLSEKAKETVQKLNSNFKNIDFVIGFNCILRYLQMKNEHSCLSTYKAITNGTNAPYYGFTTLGEQIGATHANQTLTLIALGD